MNTSIEIPRTQHWTTTALRVAAIALAFLGAVAALVSWEIYESSRLGLLIVLAWIATLGPTCLLLALASVVGDCIVYMARMERRREAVEIPDELAQ